MANGAILALLVKVCNYNKVNLPCYLISELNQESLLFLLFGGLKEKRRRVLTS